MSDPEEITEEIFKVTIAMTAFNAEDSIERALASACGQEQSREIVISEILVYDDASSDQTPKIIQAMAQQDPRIRLITGRINQGVGAARYALVEASEGDFLLFFDDDDASVSMRCLTQVEEILSYEDRLNVAAPIVFSFGLRNQLYPDGEQHVVGHIGRDSQELGPHGESLFKSMLFGYRQNVAFGFLAASALAGRRQAFRTVGNFDANFRRAEDSEFCVRAALTGAHFIGTSEVMVQQTMTLSCDKSLDLAHQATLALFDKHRALIEQEGLYPFLWRWADVKHAYKSGRKIKMLLKLLALLLRHPRQSTRRIALAQKNIQAVKRDGAFLRQGDERTDS